MRHETLDRPNLASRKKIRRAFSSKSHSRPSRRSNGWKEAPPVSLSRECEEVRDDDLPVLVVAAPTLRALDPGNENKVNELFVVRFPPGCTEQRYSARCDSIGTV